MAKPKTVAEHVIAESEFWLPDDCVLNLTAIELGGLMAALMVAKSHGRGTVMVNKRGPREERIPIALVDRLLEKVEAARAKAETDAKKLADAWANIMLADIMRQRPASRR